MSGRVFWLACALGGALGLLLYLCALPALATQSTQPQSVIISEVAWSGTAAGASYEWLELHNSTAAPVDLTGWTLTDNDLLTSLDGSIEANGFLVLEGNEFALIDIPADFFMSGLLEDSGETIRLIDGSANVVDTANLAGGPWPAGSADEHHRSMERIHPPAADQPSSWQSNNGLTRNGLDTDGHPVNGTPGEPNSSWTPSSQPNVSLNKSGPAVATSGSTIQYILTLSNTGQAVASAVILTDTLPPVASFLDDDGRYPFSRPLSQTVVWQIGAIDNGVSMSILMTVVLASDYTGLITNTAEVGSVYSETQMQDNSSTLVTWVALPEPSVLIDAVYYDGYESQDLDEAVRLINVGGSAQDMSGWRLSDGLHDAVFPDDITIQPGQGIWIADWAASFQRQFGEWPDYEVRGDDPFVPNLNGTWPGFSNAGDEVLLKTATGDLQDVLVYKAGDIYQQGWSGPALEPYALTNVFAAEGQILFRQFADDAGSRIPDSDSAADWAQSTVDAVNGRRVRYPGWDMERFYNTGWVTETAELLIGIAPDNAFELIEAELAAARSHIRIASHTFRSSAVSQELIEALDRGIEVTILLEGAPVGGIDGAERFNCQLIEDAGGQCWFMINDFDHYIYDRYRYLHAKFIIIDDRRVIVSTENLSPDSLPDDDKSDGTLGRRGVVLVTDAPTAVSRLRAVWDADFDPDNHRDLIRWPSLEADLGKHRSGFGQLSSTAETTYSVRYTEPARFSGELAHVIVQSPENALNGMVGLLPLLERAGPGDTILVEQLTEKPHWGPSSSNPVQDPNPRLAAFINAARHGATVRLLLDSFFDDQRSAVSNSATCQYVNYTAEIEYLDLRCELANPTGLALHNKMILIEIGGRGYVFVGSINGTELSNKGNREVALLLRSDGAYEFLSDMFTGDWPFTLFMPMVFHDYRGPGRHILLSEVLYDPPGVDDAEFIELYNPTPWPLDLSDFAIGDAVHRSDFEDVRRFPPRTFLDANNVLVIATTATAFTAQYGFRPDFEILDTDFLVPDLLDDKSWGDPAAILQLANMGDEVIVRDPADHIIDAIAYGTGRIQGNVSCPAVTLSGAALERFPPWRDTNDCPADFREWPFPNPGIVP